MSATLTWLGHASFRLILPDERVIMIDPWLTDNPACLDADKNLPRCDVIVLTHGHFDHVGDVNTLISEFNPIVVGNFELCAVLESLIGKGRFSGMNTGGTQSVDGIDISLTQAFHSSAVQSPKGPLYAGMPNGVVLAADGVATVYHAGDTDVFGDMQLIKQLFDPRICLLPIGGFYTMGPKGAAIAANLLEPTAIIPCHYKTFPVLSQSADEFKQALPENLRSRVVVAEIGTPLAWTSDGVE